MSRHNPAIEGPSKPESWDARFAIKDGDVSYVEAIPPRVVRERGIRGRRGMDGLFNLVSSKNARDITRKADWIAQNPFNAWNEKDMKRNGGKQRYWGALEDYDHDGLPIEFVVRKGKPTGPVVGVNGYTTSASDFPWKYDYYNAYPTEEDRQGTSFKQFMENKYKPKYGDDNMTVVDWALNPEEDPRTMRIKNHGGYTFPVPKERSPFHAMSTLIVYPIIEDIILNDFAKGNKDDAKKFRKTIADHSGSGPGFASILCSEIYNAYIIEPIYNYLRANGLMTQYLNAYIETKKRNNPNFDYDPKNATSEQHAKFGQWLHARKEFKEAAKKRATLYVSQANIGNTIAEIKPLIKERLEMLLNQEA